MCKSNGDRSSTQPMGEQAMADMKQASERNAGSANIGQARGAISVGTRIDGLYQHFRNRQIYRVACVSILDGLNIRIVTYQGIHDGRFWSRGEEAFHEYVEGQRRFTYIGQHFPG